MKVERPSVRPLLLPNVCSSASVLVAFGDELLHEPVGCVRGESREGVSAAAGGGRRRSGFGVARKAFQNNVSKTLLNHF